jgi:hypothetical protein
MLISLYAIATMTGSVANSHESLFIAGCAGAIVPNLLDWMFATARTSRQARSIAHPSVVLLYVVLGGYVAAVIIAPEEIYKAFLAGAGMDITVRCLRRAIKHFSPN